MARFFILFFRTWVCAVINRRDLRHINFCIKLCGGKRRMPQQFLERPQINTLGQKRSRKSMSQCVWCYIIWQLQNVANFFNLFLRHARCHGQTTNTFEQITLLVERTKFQILVNRIPYNRQNRNQTLFGTFSKNS